MIKITEIVLRLLLGLTLVGLSSCGENFRQEGEKGEDTTQQPLTDHPSGRTQLPTFATEAPDLFINLPPGYTVRTEKGGESDQIVILPQGGVVLSDTVPPSGLVRIVIGDSAITMDLPGTKDSGLQGRIGSYPVQWRRSREGVKGGGYFYSYETHVEGFFSRYDPDGKARELKLHAYVGGTDLSAVESLLNALTTLTARP